VRAPEAWPPCHVSGAALHASQPPLPLYSAPSTLAATAYLPRASCARWSRATSRPPSVAPVPLRHTATDLSQTPALAQRLPLEQPLNLAELREPETSEEEELDYLQHALRNPYRLDLCDLVIADTSGFWNLTEQPTPRPLDLPRWSSSGTRPLGAGGDHPPAAPGPGAGPAPVLDPLDASLLLFVHAFGSRQDLLLKVCMANLKASTGRAEWPCGSVSLPGLRAAARHRSRQAHRHELVGIVAARLLAGLAPAGGHDGPSEIALALEAFPRRRRSGMTTYKFSIFVCFHGNIFMRKLGGLFMSRIFDIY
jgi:hypothetical protein